MTLRIKIILVIFVTVITAVLIGVGISLFTFYKKGKEPVSAPTPIVNQVFEPVGQPPVEKPEVKPVSPPPPKEVSEEDKARGAITGIVLPFVETLGSYSNQGSFENLSNLLPFMTPSMKSWAQTQIDDSRSKPIPEIYKGVSTRTMNHTISKVDLSEGVSEVMVETQRKEQVGTSTNFRTFNQNILVRLKTHNDVWLVDGAFWQ
ncbi:hypothetical protein HY621_01220 [Candidatus Uhrbacteria bacterium]|nr:hypothetical protein [Candidatus Uhrbacteria bacterium]